MKLRNAQPSDFAFIRELAQRPDYVPFITDEDDAALAGYLADPTARLMICDVQGVRSGFVLWCAVGTPANVVELRRLALAKAGDGRGLEFVRTLTDYGFSELGAARIWLDASGENLRAARVYEQAGYAQEGRLRAHWHRPCLGRNVDLLLFGMLRDEWQG